MAPDRRGAPTDPMKPQLADVQAGLAEIADQLHLSVKTVSTHKTRILDKLGMESTADLVRYAVENKLS